MIFVFVNAALITFDYNDVKKWKGNNNNNNKVSERVTLLERLPGGLIELEPEP